MAVNQAQASRQNQTTVNPANDVAELRQVFQGIHATSCPLDYNFHLHTVYSDGQLQPEQLIEQATNLGLRGLAITDHHTVAGYKIAQEWLDLQLSLEELPHLWTGVEITSKLLDTEVHILGYGFHVDRPSIVPYLQGKAPSEDQAQAAIVIRAIQQAGGLAVLAHPMRYRQSAEELIPAAVQLGIDGVETYYAYNNPFPWAASPKQTQQVNHLSSFYHLLNTCGTDTHGADILRRV
jgi:predicted metal-dependent phosphoesterase TrpH